MRKKSNGRRAVYGILGAIMALTAINSVSAKETKPYEATELRLAKGSSDYNLLEGIEFDKKKYDVEVSDEGDFDIDLLGKYEVEYTLVPKDGDAIELESTRAAEVTEEETTAPETAADEVTTEAAKPENVKGEGKGEGSSSSTKESEATKDEDTETKAETKLEPESSEADTARDDTAQETSENTENSESSSYEEETEKEENTDTAEERTEAAPEVDEKADVGQATDNSSEENADTAEANADDGQADGVRATLLSTFVKRMTSRVYAAEKEVGLDESSREIHFTRNVRVVMDPDSTNIQYDEPVIRISSSTALYELTIGSEGELDTGKKEEKNEKNEKNEESNRDEADDKPASESELKAVALADELEDEAVADRMDEDMLLDEAFSFDGTTEHGEEYILTLKKPELILGDAILADKHGKEIKKASVRIKDDEALKAAVNVTEDENGLPMIDGLCPGTYEVELSAVDPSTKKEVSCARVIEIVAGGEVSFEAPVLYIGTRNESYDLTLDVIATDENGEEVTPVYVVNEEELLNARIDAEETATASEAKKSSEDSEDAEDEIVRDRETIFKPGSYHVTLGAKHPESGDEFTVEREIQIVDGYYIYAPTLDIQPGSRDYDLLSGVEVRKGSDGEVRSDIEVRVTDISSLKAAEVEEGEYSQENTEEDSEEQNEDDGEHSEAVEETEATTETKPPIVRRAMKTRAVAASTKTEDRSEADGSAETQEITAVSADDELPAVKPGFYTVTLEAQDPETGETMTVVRNVRAGLELEAWMMEAELTAYGNKKKNISYLYGEVDADRVGFKDPSGGESGWLQAWSKTVNGQEVEHNYAADFLQNKMNELSPSMVPYGVTNVARLQDGGVYEGWAYGAGAGVSYITYHYGIGNNTLVGMLGYGGDWYEARGINYVKRGKIWNGGGSLEHNYRWFTTGRIKKEYYEAIFNDKNGNGNTEESVLKDGDLIDTTPYEFSGGSAEAVWKATAQVSRNPYTGYYLTRSLYDDLNGDWDKYAESGNAALGLAEWKNVGFKDAGRNKPTMREGGIADVTIRVNYSYLDQNHLNWAGLAANPKKVLAGVDKNSSISIDGQGKQLKAGKKENNQIGNAYTVGGFSPSDKNNGGDGIQIELKNFAGIAQDYVVTPGGYLRLTANLPGNGVTASNVGILNNSGYRDLADTMVELVGPDTDQEMQLFNIWNLNDVIIRAGKAKMTPVRVVVHGQAGANQRIDLNGQTIEFYQLQNSAGWNGTTTINGKAKESDQIGRITFKNEKAPEYQVPETDKTETPEPGTQSDGDVPATGDGTTDGTQEEKKDKIENGNLLRLKNLTLESDIELEKSEYVGWSQHKGWTEDQKMDRANYSPLLIDGTFVPNGHKIKLVKDNGTPYKDGEIVAGFANETDMNSTAILDPADFELMNPKQGERADDGKYYFLVPANEGRTIKVKAIDTLPIKVTPGFGDEHDSYYKDYATALNAIIERGTGIDYTITNLLDAEFTEAANLHLNAIKKANASKLTFVSGISQNKEDKGRMYRITMKLTPQDPKNTESKALKLPSADGNQATTEVEFRDILIRSDYDFAVEDKMIVRKNPLVIFNNGGSLTFGQNCNFVSRYPSEYVENAGKNWEPMYVGVYAGAYSGTVNTDADITVTSGTFDAIYGGNQNGYYNGKYTLNVEQQDPSLLNLKTDKDGRLEIRTIDGAGASDQEKPAKKNTSIHITGPVYDETNPGELQSLRLENLYNYDLLELTGQCTIGYLYTVTGTQEGGTKKEEILGRGELNAQKISAYEGKTIMTDKSLLALSNPDGIKQIGSLRRSETVDANVRPSIMLSRPKDCNQPTCENVLTITTKDPLYAADALVGQIRVSYISNDTDQYNFSEQAKAGDYVIKLPNVEKSMYVTAKNLNANFKSGLKLIPQHEDKTKNTINALVLGEANIQIIIGYNTIVEGKPGMAFPIEEDSVASALDALIIRMKQVPEIKDYTLSFAVSGYTMTETDHQMMQDKRLRTLNSLNWTGRFQYDPNGTEHVKEPDDINNVSTVIVNNDLNFYVQNTEISALKLQYAERHNIFANGSKLKMGLHVTMLGNEAVLPILYGGADGTAAGVTAEDMKVPGTSLTIQSGRYHEIYGGGKGRNADIQGDVEINLDGYAYVVDKDKPLDLSMTAVHGSGSDGSQLDRDRTSSIKILNSVSLAGSENWEEGHVFSYPLNIKSVDRFDHFYVGAEEQLKLNPQVTIGERILSVSANGVYTGELHLYTADIMLKGKTSSHVGNIAAHGKYNSLQLNIDETTRKTVPLLVDGKLSMLPEESNQLRLQLEKDQDAYNGAILLSFNQEPNAIEEQYKTNIPKYSVGKDEKNIILEGAMVYVLTFSHKEGDERFYSPSTYPSIAKALNGIGERMAKNPAIAEDDGTLISIFGDSYQFTAKDLTALEYAAKEHATDEAMPSNIKTLKYLGEVKNAKKISWRNNKAPDGKTSNPKPALLGDGIGTVKELWLPGKSTDMLGLALDFKSPFNIYADGKPLRLDAYMKITAKDGWYPSLYGGSNRPIDGNTDLTVQSGHYTNIYGGGYSENTDTAKVTGDASIKLEGRIVVDETLSGMGKGIVRVTGKKSISIKPYMEINLDVFPPAISYISDANVSILEEFDELSLGQANGKSNITIQNRLRGVLTPYVRDDFRGNVLMENTTLTFKNDAFGWFSNLTSTGKDNLILLSKKTNSNPLRLREKTTVSVTETEIPGTLLQKPTIKREFHPIEIGIDGQQEDRGDVAVVYDVLENAIVDQYCARKDSGFAITRQENKLIIDEDNDYYVKTKNGQEGLIKKLMVPDEYRRTLRGIGNGYGNTFSQLYDSKNLSWNPNAPLVATDLRYGGTRPYYYKTHFDEGEKKMKGKSKSGEEYDISEYHSAKNNLPVFAGMKDTFTFGAIKNLNSTDIANAWNTRNTNSLYYYDSTNHHQDPKWENLGEGKDLYDWETGEWVDDPDVTVRRIKRVNSYTPEGICNEFTWTINDPNSGILDSHLKNSSMVIDFDQKGDGNVSDFSEIRWNAGRAWAPVPPSMGQVSFKNLYLTLADPKWNGSDNQKTFKMIQDGQVMRFDSWVGNGQGYYWTYPNSDIRSTDTFGLYSQGQLPNSVVQVKLSDTYAQNPAFMFHGQIGKYMIKAGAVEHNVPMDIANFMKVAEFDTGETGVIKMISIRADGGEGNLNSVIRLKGTGILAMVNTFEVYHWKDNNYIPYCWFYRWMGAGHVISNAFELMNDGFTYAVANYHPRYGHLDIRHMRTNEVISNGHKLKVLRSDMLCGYYRGSTWVDNYSTIPLATSDLTEGYYVARTFRTDGVLDPTDFELEMKKNPETGELLNPGSIGLFFTREIHNGLHHIRVVRIKDPDTNQIVTKPIKVIPAVEGVSYYDNYKAAFEAIQAHGESTTDYTVKNLVEWDFTEADAQALVEIDAAHAASLTLEGGLRNNNNVIAQGRLDTNDVNAIARDYYRVRLRKQALMMPDDVPVTFNNIILKYDQGNTHELNGEDGRIQTEDIVFINNGSGLRFGDKVQFLKHQDEEASATVYGGSVKDPAAYGWDGFSNAHGKTTNKANIQIASGTFTQVYGGGTKAQGGGINQILDYFRTTPTDIGADITITGGTIGKIFGGGQGRDGVMHGNATITIDGKTEITSQTIYGGGDGAELDGSTSVEITAEKAYEKFSKNNTVKRTIHPGVSQDENIQTSVYGGGHNAAVTGNTSVNMKLLNDATNHSYYFGTLSGFGTVDETVVDENGEETNEIRLSQDSVKGTTEKVVITQDDPKSATYVNLGTLSGFSELGLGKAERTGGDKNNFNAFHVTVNERFDGNASEQSNLLTTKRGDTVKLYAVALTLRGEWQGHIGSMEVTDTCAIKITKTDTNIYPLILDGQVTQDEPMNQIRLRTDPKKNAVKDKILSFTDAQFAIPTQYVDGEDTGLSVDTLAEGTVKHIIFTLPQTHIAESYVTYATPSEIEKVEPGEETTADTTTGRGDAGEGTTPGAATEKFVLDEETDPATTPKKVLHYIYDAEHNEHEIKGGYVVALPKAFMPAGTADSGDLSQYLVMNTGFINQTDKNTLGPLPTFTNPEVKAYEIRFENGSPHGQTEPIVIDDDKYWYLAHFTCRNGDPFTLLTDVSAPIKTMAELQVSLDTEQKLYKYTLTYRDFSETDDTKLPWQTIRVQNADGTEKEVKHLLPYNANGVTSVYWSLGSGDGAGEANLLADWEAAKRLEDGITVNPDGTALRGQGTVKSLDGKDQVSGGDVALATIQVPQALVEANEEQGVIWAYLKDQHNNTVKVAIPLNQNIINVRVPLEVYVVAVKKENTTDATPELLAPNCYVKNEGVLPIDAKIAGFKPEISAETNKRLRLSDKTTQAEFDGVADEISLFIRRVKKDSLGDTLPETLSERNNVLSLKENDPKTWLSLGELSYTKMKDARTKDFTFDALYNPQLINELGNGEWLKSTMSYNFSIVR